MKKLLVALLLGLSLVSCETEELFNEYTIKYTPEQNMVYINDILNQNGIVNLSSDSYNNSITVKSKNDIKYLTLYHISGRFEKINNKEFKIIFTENNWLQDNYNSEINLRLVTYK